MKGALLTGAQALVSANILPLIFLSILNSLGYVISV
jgi:hypothetical protein